MENKLLPERIRPVFPSHPYQTVTGYPVAADTTVTDNRPLSWCCVLFTFVVAVCVIWFIIIIHYVPELPSISIKSMSMTVITNASDSQVKANLELVFDPVENMNKHNSIIYDRVNVTAFDVKKGLFSDATFEQRGRDKRAVVVRMENVTVDVSEYEQHMYGRCGVSDLSFEIAGLVRIEGGKWAAKRTSSMTTGCSEVSKKVVFPLYQWNQTQRLHFQPNICHVDGDWENFKVLCELKVVSIIIIFFFLAVLLGLPLVCFVEKKLIDRAATERTIKAIE